MDLSEIETWLRETDDDALRCLWQRADCVRRDCVGDQVHLRGLVEFSNYCARSCAYCGLHRGNRSIPRYRMTPDEIVDCARLAHAYGYGAVVLQSGEDRGMETATLSGIIGRIKQETNLAVTLSVGERDIDEFAEWRAAGADRYLLRFETSNPSLYARIHPDLPGRPSDRIALLAKLRKLGYEVGSGVMIGIPGQTYADLAQDIAQFAALNLDMVGVGPYIPHPDTPLGAQAPPASPEQAPNTEMMTYKTIAITRIVCPYANIPATTALATLNRRRGRELGLLRGANVLMPNMTPVKYRHEYQIYPDKACLMEDAAGCRVCMRIRVQSIGRYCGTGRGDSPNFSQREVRTA